jgi:hypothetical protein
VPPHANFACVGVGAIPTARELLTDIPRPLSDVSVDFTFPNIAQSQQFVVGEVVTTLLTVRNDHASPINVTYLSGSINSPRNYNIYLHNFTTLAYHAVLPPGAERSFEYMFGTPVNMPARQFQMAMSIFYSDVDRPGSQFAATFYNRTVEMVEPEKLIDTEALFLYSTLAAIAAAIGVL